MRLSRLSNRQLLRLLKNGEVRFGIDEDRRKAREESSKEAQKLWKEVERVFGDYESRILRIGRLWDLGHGDKTLLNFIQKATDSLNRAGIDIQRVQYKLKQAERHTVK